MTGRRYVTVGTPAASNRIGLLDAVRWPSVGGRQEIVAHGRRQRRVEAAQIARAGRRERSRGSPAAGSCHGSPVKITAAAASSLVGGDHTAGPALVQVELVDPLARAGRRPGAAGPGRSGRRPGSRSGPYGPAGRRRGPTAGSSARSGARSDCAPRTRPGWFRVEPSRYAPARISAARCGWSISLGQLGDGQPRPEQAADGSGELGPAGQLGLQAERAHGLPDVVEPVEQVPPAVGGRGAVRAARARRTARRDRWASSARCRRRTRSGPARRPPGRRRSGRAPRPGCGRSCGTGRATAPGTPSTRRRVVEHQGAVAGTPRSGRPTGRRAARWPPTAAPGWPGLGQPEGGRQTGQTATDATTGRTGCRSTRARHHHSGQRNGAAAIRGPLGCPACRSP